MKTIGKYELTAEIGRGAMGEVYKARDPLIGRMVALKVITGGLSNKPELLERFYQEARSAGALQHPNIVTVYELGKESGLPFIAMEYLGGESLEKIIARQAPLPLVQKIGYVIQICRALEYAHKHGVVHRDIKPGNIMTTSEGTIKVVDFGIARLVDASKTQTGTLIGTLGYMSPQQLRGEHADERSDIWAVGVLLYEMLAYKRPFQGDSPATLMMSIMSHEPPPLAGTGCTKEVEAIILQMLKKEAIDRYQTMEEVLFDLDPVYQQLQQSRVVELVDQSHRLIEGQDLRAAQQTLREALHADSSHVEAKTLLENVSRELRRQQVLPKVKDQISKAKEMLAAGQFQQAKAKVQAALQLDSTFEPARDLLGEVQRAAEQARELDKKMRIAKQRIAEGSLTEANRQLDDVLALDPQNPHAKDLRRQILEDASRKETRKRLSESLRHARDLWSQLRYAECIGELLELQKEFPGNVEITKLLETARRDQAEEERQKQLAEVRNLLASQRYEQARRVLDSLQKDFPNDPAVQNLLDLTRDEQVVAASQQRLQGELSRLRSLANEGRHSEVLAGAEALLVEFPGNFDLTELANFSRAEVRRGEQTDRLDQALRNIREGIDRGSFAQARRAAEKALGEFPGNADLKALAEEVTRREFDKERQGQIEKRIRELKTRIDSHELTDAIEMARETIATLGPDTTVTGLLEAAESERKERKMQDARGLLNAGKVDEASQMVDQALATQMFDAADPLVKTFQTEVEQKKKVDAAQTLLGAGKVDEAAAIVDQALATQLLDAADPRVKTFWAEVKKTKRETTPAESSSSQPEPIPAEEFFSATAISAPAESRQPGAASAVPPKPIKTRRKAKGKSAGTAPSEKSPAKGAVARKSKMPMHAAAGVAVALIIGVGAYFATRHAPKPTPAVIGQTVASTNQPPTNPALATPPPANLPPTTPAPVTPARTKGTATPSPKPLEKQQQNLMDQAQALAGQGHFAEALQDLDKALQLNGPLETSVRDMRTQIASAQSKQQAQAALQQKQNQMWNQAVKDYQQDNLSAAARGFQQVVAQGAGSHQSEARRYLETLIPQARKSDTLLLRAQTLAKNVNDPPSLKQASQDLQQVVDAHGPRAAQASRLQAQVKTLLDADTRFQQLVKEYDANARNIDGLRKVQSEFRALENVKGTVGSTARLYAEERIPADLKYLQSKSPHASAAASAQRFPWVVSVEASSVSGERLGGHPLSEKLVSRAAAKHQHFQLQLSIDSRGRVTGGRLLSGDASLGRSLIGEVKKGWRFSAPGQKKASVQVSVEF